jgi:fumarate hydratase class I
MIGLGIGGSSDKAMLLAKEALLEPINMSDLQARGPSTPEEEMRLELYEKINALGIGAQGLGGLTTVVDVKIKTFPTHAASKPVGLVPQCAANRHVEFVLDGSGPAQFDPPDLSDWPEITLDRTAHVGRRVNLNTLTPEEIKTWRPGEILLLSGALLTGRDAAHKRLTDMIRKGAIKSSRLLAFGDPGQRYFLAKSHRPPGEPQNKAGNQAAQRSWVGFGAERGSSPLERLS